MPKACARSRTVELPGSLARENVTSFEVTTESNQDQPLQTLIAARITGIMMPKLKMNLTMTALPFE